MSALSPINCLEELTLLDFDSAWLEAHSRHCEWEIRTGLCDAVYCGRTIHAYEYPHVWYCEKHAQE